MIAVRDLVKTRHIRVIIFVMFERLVCQLCFFDQPGRGVMENMCRGAMPALGVILLICCYCDTGGSVAVAFFLE